MKNEALNLGGYLELGNDELSRTNGGGLGYVIGYIMGSIAGAYENMAGHHSEYVAMTRCYAH